MPNAQSCVDTGSQKSKHAPAHPATVSSFAVMAKSTMVVDPAGDSAASWGILLPPAVTMPEKPCLLAIRLGSGIFCSVEVKISPKNCLLFLLTLMFAFLTNTNLELTCGEGP